MTDIKKLIGDLAALEKRTQETPFLAPCVQGGRVQVRLDGLVQTFRPKPRDFEGWGVFLAQGTEAVLQEEAGLPLIAEYQKMLSSHCECALRIGSEDRHG